MKGQRREWNLKLFWKGWSEMVSEKFESREGGYEGAKAQNFGLKETQDLKIGESFM